MSINTGTVECSSADGFDLLPSMSTTAPSLTLTNVTIQNTENAIVASAGTATITTSNIWFNHNGVTQLASGTIDLSGGGNNSRDL